MATEINTIVIHEKDNVATVKTNLKQGDSAVYQREKSSYTLSVVEDIPQFHKLALEDIAQGDPVFKYGQLIGTALCPIQKGQHVHVHNIASPEN